MKKKITSITLASILCFSMIACTPTTSNLVKTLNAVSDAASVAVVVTSALAALGKVDANVPQQVSVYTQGVTTAVQTSITELNSTDTNPQKINVISTAFAKVAVPAFSNAPQVSAVIDVVSTAVKVFLSNLQSTGILKLAVNAPTAQIKLTRGDRTMLKNIQKKTTETKISALKLALQ